MDIKRHIKSNLDYRIIYFKVKSVNKKSCKGVRIMGNNNKITIRVSEDRKEELKKVAEDMGLTVSSVVKLAVSDFLKKNK